MITSKLPSPAALAEMHGSICTLEDQTCRSERNVNLLGTLYTINSTESATHYFSIHVDRVHIYLQEYMYEWQSVKVDNLALIVLPKMTVISSPNSSLKDYNGVPSFYAPYCCPWRPHSKLIVRSFSTNSARLPSPTPLWNILSPAVRC